MKNPRHWIGTGVFISIWLVVLCVPTLRRMLRAQQSESIPPLYEYSWMADFSNREFDIKRLARLHPDDARVQAKEVESRPYRRDELSLPARFSQRDVVAAYDRLLQRFPNQAWLVANRLRLTMPWFQDDRLAGDFEDTRLVPGTTPAPEKRSKTFSTSASPGSPVPLPSSSDSTYPTFSPLELSRAIAAAQKGRRLEPDNCFFDWMLAYFLMSGYRDEEALRVLKEGSHKTRFDDHTPDDAKATIAVYEMVRPLLIEEKMGVMESEQFPHLGPLRHLSLLLSWKAWKLERNGDHARALQIRGDLTRICVPMTRGRNLLLTGLSGESFQAIAWAGNPKRSYNSIRNQMPPNLKQGSASWTRAQWRLMARQFALYARAHGRIDLAREATRAGEKTGRLRVAEIRIMEAAKQAEFFGIARGTLFSIYGLWILSRAAFVQIVMLALICSVLSVVLFGSRSQPHERRDLFWSVGAGTCLAAVFTACSLRLNIGYGDGFVNPHMALGEWSAPVIALWAFVVAPLIASVLVPWAVTLWRVRHDRDVLLKPPPPRYEGESARLMVPHDHLPLILKTTIQFTVGSMFAFWLVALITCLGNDGTSHSFDTARIFAVAASVLSLVCYFGWLIKWRWFAPPLLRPIRHAALRWHRQTLSLYIIVASLFWIVFSLFSIVPRRAANVQFNDYLKRGEIAQLQLK